MSARIPMSTVVVPQYRPALPAHRGCSRQRRKTKTKHKVVASLPFDSKNTTGVILRRLFIRVQFGINEASVLRQEITPILVFVPSPFSHSFFCSSHLFSSHLFFLLLPP